MASGWKGETGSDRVRDEGEGRKMKRVRAGSTVLFHLKNVEQREKHETSGTAFGRYEVACA